MHKFTALAASLLGLILLLFVAQAWLWHDRLNQTNHNREANARIWKAVVCQIETAALAKTKGTSERQLLITFYDGLLIQDVHTVGCGLTP